MSIAPFPYQHLGDGLFIAYARDIEAAYEKHCQECSLPHMEQDIVSVFRILGVSWDGDDSEIVELDGQFQVQWRMKQ